MFSFILITAALLNTIHYTLQQAEVKSDPAVVVKHTLSHSQQKQL